MWNKIDLVADPSALRAAAAARGDVVIISAVTGEGVQELRAALQAHVQASFPPPLPLLGVFRLSPHPAGGAAGTRGGAPRLVPP